MKNLLNSNIIKHSKDIVLNKNEVLFSEGDECKSIGIVISGQLNISTNSYIDNEFNITTINQGDTFGENLLFSNKPYYLGNVYATKQTVVKMISKEDYINYVKSNIIDYINDNSNKYLFLQQRMKILLQKSIKEKIIFYLISKSNMMHTNNIPIKSKEELAKYLNIERPSLSRELINLKKDGYIDYNKHYITIKKKPE